MKKILLSLIGFLVSLMMFSQAPHFFKYQAVARESNGELIINQAINFQIRILQGSTVGSAVYSESHSASTNAYGLVNLEIGNGTTGDDFAAINWATGPYFIEITMNGTLMGASQLLSVPYAKYAEISSNTNLPQYTQSQIDNMTPVAGRLIFNTNTNDIQFYNGMQWQRFFISNSLKDLTFNGDTLSVHPIDNSPAVQSYNGSYINTFASSNTDGAANTDSIVKYQGEGAYAAYLCDTLNAYGYDDWYLPAKNELNALYANRLIIGGFDISHYWSSTEFDNSFAWIQHFGDGTQTETSKDQYFAVRCIRKN